MPFFIFNQNDKQRADFYESQITDVQILWQGESLETFELETGFSINQLGGFVSVGGTLTFNQSIKDAHDAPQVVPKTSQDMLRELTSLITSLDDETQADLSEASGKILNALTFGQVGVAKVLTTRIETNGNLELDALKEVVLSILNG